MPPSIALCRRSRSSGGAAFMDAALADSTAEAVSDMRRGDVVAIALRGDFGKPRPALVRPGRCVRGHPTVTVLLVTGASTDAPPLRVPVTPSPDSALRQPSQVTPCPKRGEDALARRFAAIANNLRRRSSDNEPVGKVWPGAPGRAEARFRERSPGRRATLAVARVGRVRLVWSGSPGWPRRT